MLKLEKARTAAADLAAILYKPLNILPIGLYVLQKCDKILVEKKADFRCLGNWSELEENVKHLIMPTDEALASSTCQAELLSPWFAVCMKSSQMLPTVSGSFKEQRAELISRMENEFEVLRNKLCDVHMRSCNAVGHAALESLAAVTRTSPPSMTVEEELALLALQKIKVDEWAARVDGCENEIFTSLGKLGDTSSIYVDLRTKTEVYVDFVHQLAVSLPFIFRHWALKLPAAAKRKAADSDVGKLLEEDSILPKLVEYKNKTNPSNTNNHAHLRLVLLFEKNLDDDAQMLLHPVWENWTAYHKWLADTTESLLRTKLHSTIKEPVLGTFFSILISNVKDLIPMNGAKRETLKNSVGWSGNAVASMCTQMQMHAQSFGQELARLESIAWGTEPVPTVYYVMAPIMANLTRMYFDFVGRPLPTWEAVAKTSDKIAHILKNDVAALLSMSTEANSMIELFEVVLPDYAASDKKDPKIDLLWKKQAELAGIVDTILEQSGSKAVKTLLTSHLEQGSTLAETVSKELEEFLSSAVIDTEAVGEYVTNSDQASALFAVYTDWKAVTTALNKFTQKMNLATETFQKCHDKESTLWPAVKLAVVHCSLLAAALRPLNPKETRKKVIDAARKNVKDDMRLDAKLDALVRQVEAAAE